jgi:putative transposase
MVKRGLQTPVLVTTDGTPGLIRAVGQVFRCSLRQRCLAHKTRNVTDKVPDSVPAEIRNAVRAAYYALNPEVADMIAADVLSTYQRDYPAAMHSLQDDWEASVAYLRCPAIHHKRIRTTNLLQRSFLEERRRTRTIPRFFSEKSCLKLVFATSRRDSQRWQGVGMSYVERRQLKLLRRQLALPPDGTRDDVGLKVQRIAA